MGIATRFDGEHGTLSPCDGLWKANESDELTFHRTDTVYFESSAGMDKAKYWTSVLENAYIFALVEDAIAMLLQNHREHSPVTILKVKGQEK